MSRALLEKVLIDCCGLQPELEISTEEKGRRFVDERYGIFFSITHTENYWFCSISEKRNGIDAESCTRRVFHPEKMADRFLTEEEQVYLRNAGTDRRKRECFIYLWTRKEAWLKFTGEGLYGLHEAPSVVGPPEGTDLRTLCRGNLYFSVCTKKNSLRKTPRFICLDI